MVSWLIELEAALSTYAVLLITCLLMTNNLHAYGPTREIMNDLL